MKVLKTAAIVVGVAASIALAATGVGIIGSGAILGLTTGALTAVSVGASLVSAALNVISPPKASSGSAIGSQTEITLDPQAGDPYAMGRTFYAGKLVHQDTFGTDNKYIGSVIVYSSGGPIHAFESWSVDNVAVTFSGGNAVGTYHNFLWLSSQLGACPEAVALASSQGSLPNWGASYKLSGKAAGLWTLLFDKAGKQWASGYPQTGAVLNGVLVYDPRLDSTYPGGSGTCRSNDETTFVYSESPALHGITWALGRYQNGERVIGVGEPVDGIDMPAWVEFANTCDANAWKVGGVISSEDDKWDVLKQICQAGAGQPMRIGGLLSVDFQRPRVSLATIASSDLLGDAKAARYKRRRDRFNSVIGRYRSEDHGWQIISADPVPVADYVTADGGTITRGIDYPLVQDLDQLAELAKYDIYETREFDGATLPLRTVFIGYKPGDCLTIDIPELLPAPQTAVVTNRALDPSTAVATLTMKSETDAKHDGALGSTGTVAAPISLDPGTPPSITQFPFVQDQLLISGSGVSGLSADGEDIGGGSVTVTISDHDRVYLDKSVSVTGGAITGLALSTVYGIYYDDPSRAGGAVTYHATATLLDSVNSNDNPYRHQVAIVPAVSSGGTSDGGGAAPGGGAGGSGGGGFSNNQPY